jgi:hypothetical protein
MHVYGDFCHDCLFEVLDMILNPKPYPFQNQRETKKNKIKREAYVSLWPFLQIVAYAIFTLPKWLETINKLNLTLNQPKRVQFGQRK